MLRFDRKQQNSAKQLSFNKKQIKKKHKYWSVLPFPSPEDLPSSGIKPVSPVWQADSLMLSHLGSPKPGLSDVNSSPLH